MTKDAFVNLSNASRSKDDTYKKVIEEITEHKVCPFCPEELSKYHKNPILKKGEFWVVTKNMYPYKNTSVHMLFIHISHITDFKEISPDAWAELHTLSKEVENDYKIPGGAFFMRFGNTHYTGSTVSHLHAHLISPDKDIPGYDPIMVRLG